MPDLVNIRKFKFFISANLFLYFAQVNDNYLFTHNLTFLKLYFIFNKGKEDVILAFGGEAFLNLSLSVMPILL